MFLFDRLIKHIYPSTNIDDEKSIWKSINQELST